MQFWNEMEGKTVAARYKLGRLLRSAGRSAWFDTQDEQQKPRVILITESLNDDDRLLQNLEAAARVHHPNVVAIGKTGQARIDDKPVVFAILEPTEENLGEVLRERALSPAETATIAESLVAGLSAIHAAGLFHGQVSAANVLASGDTLKLRSDCLQTIPTASQAESFAQDTGDLGATVFESLTQRKLTSPQDAAIDKLPAPFRAIVLNAVTGTWGLAEIATELKKPGSVSARPPVVAVPVEAVPKPVARPVEERKQTPTPAPVKKVEAKPAAVAAKPMPASAKPAANVPKRGSMVRVIAIIALVAALGMIWYFYKTASTTSRSAENTVPAGPAQSAPGQQPAPPSDTPAAMPTVKRPARHARADTAPVAALPAAAPAAAPPSDTTGRSDHKVWRVVVYTYGRAAEAQAKVDSLNAAHPEWKPEVFSPAGHGPWLVTLGGPMDRAGAFQLRSQVRQQGLPGDSYAQNFTH